MLIFVVLKIRQSYSAIPSFSVHIHVYNLKIHSHRGAKSLGGYKYQKQLFIVKNATD